MDYLLLAIVLFAALYIWSQKTQEAPPTHFGPKPVPVLGNVLDLTANELWVRATSWARRFGDVVYLHIFGQGLVFLNTYEAASDLMDKRSAIYSDKPPLVMATELCGCENMTGFVRYGEASRRQRKFMTQALGPNAIKTYRPLLEIETHALLRRLAADPTDFTKSFRRCVFRH